MVKDYSAKLKQLGISKSMRAVLVDWLVEVQESFELNHETLYNGVRLFDLYISSPGVSFTLLTLLACSVY